MKIDEKDKKFILQALEHLVNKINDIDDKLDNLNDWIAGKGEE